MVSPNSFFKALHTQNVDFFTGVPDSLLKDFCTYVADAVTPSRHLIAANEGNAVALAIGYYLATSRYGLVYMQNSGLGNAVNPLISLADAKVYSIPLLLLIGWRGEEGIPDEPQHKKQGIITLPLLDTLGIPFFILPQENADALKIITQACAIMNKSKAPVALVVRNGTFASYKKKKQTLRRSSLSREQALRVVMEGLPKHAVVVSTTGKLSRELFEFRHEKNMGHGHDFLTVGGMGHAASIALAIALAKPKRRVYCFDGDGAAIMHLGGWGTIGKCSPKNFKHIVFNNAAHDSVGGQPTAASSMDFLSIARACGYKHTVHAKTVGEIKTGIKKLRQVNGPAILEISIAVGARDNLGRPTRTPAENKRDFMKFITGNDRTERI